MRLPVHCFPVLALAFAANVSAADQAAPAAPVASTAPAAAPPPPPPPPQAKMSAAECAVWAREMSFAKTVADHDAAAFAEHVHPEAAFGSGRAVPTRGRDAVGNEWAELVAGKVTALSWYPSRVTIGGVKTIAASSGPALFEDLAPNANPHYYMSRFHSVWSQGKDGVWRILFDDGTALSPVTDAQAAAFKSQRLTACPRA